MASRFSLEYLFLPDNRRNKILSTEDLSVHSTFQVMAFVVVDGDPERAVRRTISLRMISSRSRNQRTTRANVRCRRRNARTRCGIVGRSIKTHFTLPCTSCSNAFSASRLSPWMSILSRFPSAARFSHGYDFSAILDQRCAGTGDLQSLSDTKVSSKRYFASWRLSVPTKVKQRPLFRRQFSASL